MTGDDAGQLGGHQPRASPSCKKKEKTAFTLPHVLGEAGIVNMPGSQTGNAGRHEQCLQRRISVMKELWGDALVCAPKAEPRDSDQTRPPAAAPLGKPQGDAAQVVCHMVRGKTSWSALRWDIRHHWRE